MRLYKSNTPRLSKKEREALQEKRLRDRERIARAINEYEARLAEQDLCQTKQPQI